MQIKEKWLNGIASPHHFISYQKHRNNQFSLSINDSYDSLHHDCIKQSNT